MLRRHYTLIELRCAAVLAVLRKHLIMRLYNART
jgi:hypothetical protein